MAKNILELQKEMNAAKTQNSVVIKKENQSTGSPKSSAPKTSTGKTTDLRAKMQKKKEDAAEAASPSAVERKANSAKKALEEYLASDERKAWEKKQQDGKFAQSLLFGTPVDQQPDVADQKEKQLKKEADYWAGKATAEREAKIQERDTKALESWDDADKEELERYIQNRQSAFVQSLNPAATGMPAQYEESYLIKKYGRQRLDEIASSYQRQKNAEKKQMQEQRGRDMANSGWIGAIAGNAASVGTNLADTLLNPLERIANMAGGKDERYSTIDPNAGGQAAAFTSGVRDQTAKNIAGSEEGVQLSDGITGREALALGYQGGMSALDTAARSAVSMAPWGGSTAVGAGLAAMGSFNQTLADASAKGATPEQAIALATTTAGIEALTEKIPMDELLKVAKAGGKAPAKVFLNVLKQMGVEIAEEEASLIGTTLAEAAILQEKSSFNQQIMEAVAAGVPLEEARAAAYQAILEEAKQTAIVSGIAGGFGAAGAEITAAKYGGTEDSQQPPAGAQSEQTAADNPTQAIEEQAEQTTQEQPQAAQKDGQEQMAQQAAMQEQAEKETAQDGQEQPGPDNWMVNTFRDASGENQKTAASEETTDTKEYIRMEDYANNESPVWRNVDYNDDATKASITQETHQQMMDSGAFVKVSDDALHTAEQSFPDLRGMKKKDRAPILKDSISKLKGNLRQFLGKLSGQPFEFEVNGKILEAKLYSTGINEVLEKVTKEKAGMLYSTEQIFRNARYLYSTPDYDGDSNVYRWNYFYTPVQIGDDTVGVRIAVRDMVTPQESQIYNWGIKKDAPLGGVGHTPNGRTSHGASSDASGNIIPDNGAKVNGNVGSTQQTDTNGQSTEGGQQKAGNGETKTGGDVPMQRARPDDVRPVKIPVTDDNGNRVSETVGNAHGSALTSDEMAEQIEKLVKDGDLGFGVRTNRESLENAASEIKKRGYETSKRQITKRVESRKIKDGDIEQAILLYQKYVDNNDLDNASEMMVDLATMGNITGRNLQLFKMLRKMTPEGQALTIRKEVQRSVESMVRSGQVKKGYEPSINESLMDDYFAAAKEAQKAKDPGKKAEAEQKMQEIQRAIYMDEAAKMPSTFKAKWDAWRYMCMLGNVKTQARNFVGNTMFMPYKAAKDKMAAAFEKVLPKEERTKSLVTDQALLNWAKGDAKTEQVNNALKYTAKIGDRATSSIMEENKTVFDSKILEKARKAVEAAPRAGDMLFKNDYYARSLAGFLKARGYTAQQVQSGQVSDAVLDEARQYAVNEAMKATFNDSNWLSDTISSIGFKNADNPVKQALNIAAEGILPFRRTPANIVVRFAEYSPAGLVKGTADMVRHIAGGKVTAAEAIDQMAAGMTGTGMMLLGYMMAAGWNGIKLTGSGNDEDEKRQGHQDYALEFSIDGEEYSYRIDWAAPANLPLFVGANIYKTMQEKGADPDVSRLTAASRGMLTMFEPMLSLSCLSSFNDLVEGIRYAKEGEALYSIAADVATSYFTQGIPTLARQAYQASQEVKQTTFANDADPTVRDIQKTVSNVPFAGAKFQTDKVNPWGETEDQGNWMERSFQAFINPGTEKKIDNSKLEQELSRLNDAQETNVTPPTAGKVISYTDKNGNAHLDVRLTEEQYQTLAQEQGQTAKRILETMVQSEDYTAMTDSQRADAIREVYSYAREKAEIAAIGEEHSGFSAEWMMNLTEGREEKTILGKVVRDNLSSSISGINTAWEKGYDTTAKSNELQWAYDTFEKMSLTAKNQIRKESSAGVKNYLEARGKGISHEKYLDVAKSLDGIKPETGYSGTRSIQKAETVSKASGLTESQKELLIKQQVSDSQDRNIDELKSLCKNLDGVSYSTQLYAKLYRDAEDYTSGTGKKKRTAAKWAQEYGISKKAAEKLYEVFK